MIYYALAKSVLSDYKTGSRLKPASPFKATPQIPIVSLYKNTSINQATLSLKIKEMDAEKMINQLLNLF